MPFNYLSTVIITEADTQPEDGETDASKWEEKGSIYGRGRGDGGRSKLAVLKTHRMWSYKFPCFQII